MKRVDYVGVSPEAIAGIKNGAFLTVKAGNKLNTMTIGWATTGYVWRKPVVMVAVRSTRYTFEIIEEAKDFTVSIPSGDMSKEIDFCGTKSGKDFDKFKECGLHTAPAAKTVSPIIKIPGIHYECNIIYKSAMDPNHLDAEIKADIYAKKDYHTLYFGEVLDCYRID